MMFNISEGNLRAFLTSLITVELLKTRGQKIDPTGLHINHFYIIFTLKKFLGITPFFIKSILGHHIDLKIMLRQN